MNKINSAVKGTIGYYIRRFLPVFIFSLPLSGFAQTDTVKKIGTVEIVSGKIPAVKSLMPVQTIRRQDFTKYSANNVADAIRDFSGVNIKDYGGIGGLKTVSVRSLGANHTGVLYDGVQLNDVQNGQVDLGKITLDDLASIELFSAQPADLLQPASAYAFASVLSLKTIKPQLTVQHPVKLEATIKAGSFGLFEPAVQYQQLLDKNLTLRMNTLRSTANGKYKYKVDGDGSDGFYERNNADQTAYRADAQINYTRDSISSLSLTVNYYASQRGLPGAIIFYNDASEQRLWNDEWFVQGMYRHRLKRFELLINSKFSNDYARYLDPKFLNQQGKLDQKYLQRAYYQSIAVDFDASKGLVFSYAADGTINTLSTNLYQFVYPVRYSILQVVAGNYKTGIWNFGANLLNTSIKESVKTGKPMSSRFILSPALMVSAGPFKNSGLQFRLFYKDIFRAPTFNDLYYSRIGNINLDPETVKQYNAGIVFSKALAGRLNFITATADVYYNDVHHKIVAIPSKDIFSWTMLNLGKADIRGIDISTRTAYTFSKQFEWLFTGNYTFQNAVDVTDPASPGYLSQIPYVPKHTFSLNTGFNYKGLGIFYNQIYASHRYYLSENLPEFLLPGFSVADLSLAWSSAIRKISFKTTMEINNLFNARYAVVRSFPMPGRTFSLSVHVKI